MARTILVASAMCDDDDQDDDGAEPTSPPTTEGYWSLFWPTTTTTTRPGTTTTTRPGTTPTRPTTTTTTTRPTTTTTTTRPTTTTTAPCQNNQDGSFLDSGRPGNYRYVGYGKGRGVRSPLVPSYVVTTGQVTVVVLCCGGLVVLSKAKTRARIRRSAASRTS